jgi:hypothetical protein
MSKKERSEIEKLYEALSTLSDSQSPLLLKLVALELKASHLERLKPFSFKIVDAFKAMEEELQKIVQEEKESQ